MVDTPHSRVHNMLAALARGVKRAVDVSMATWVKDAKVASTTPCTEGQPSKPDTATTMTAAVLANTSTSTVSDHMQVCHFRVCAAEHAASKGAKRRPVIPGTYMCKRCKRIQLAHHKVTKAMSQIVSVLDGRLLLIKAARSALAGETVDLCRWLALLEGCAPEAHKTLVALTRTAKPDVDGAALAMYAAGIDPHSGTPARAKLQLQQMQAVTMQVARCEGLPACCGGQRSWCMNKNCGGWRLKQETKETALECQAKGCTPVELACHVCGRPVCAAHAIQGNVGQAWCLECVTTIQAVQADYVGIHCITHAAAGIARMRVTEQFPLCQLEFGEPGVTQIKAHEQRIGGPEGECQPANPGPWTANLAYARRMMPARPKPEGTGDAQGNPKNGSALDPSPDGKPGQEATGDEEASAHRANHGGLV